MIHNIHYFFNYILYDYMIHFPYRLRILVQVHSIWSHFMRTSVFRWQFVFAGCSARQRRPSPSNRVWGSRNHGKMALTALTTSSASFLSAVTFNRLQVAWWENKKIWEIHQPFVVRCVHKHMTPVRKLVFWTSNSGQNFIAMIWRRSFWKRFRP